MMARLRWERHRFGLNWRAGGAVRERARFVARETLGRRCTSEYRLRGSGHRAVIRHSMVDAPVLLEVFGMEEYALPPAIRERLLALGRPVRVLDLGGNVGLFGLYIHDQLPGATLVSFEPDPLNLRVLERCVRANEGLSWTVVAAAASTTDGEASLISDSGRAQLESVAQEYGGHVTLDRWLPQGMKPPPAPPTTTVSIKDVFPYLQQCDLLKVDIEGGEWDLLRDPRFADTSAVAMVMEVHPLPSSDCEAMLETALRRSGLVLARPWVAGAMADVVWAHKQEGPPVSDD